MSHRTGPPSWWLVVCSFAIALALAAWAIIQLALPDSLLLIFIVPCVLMASYFKRPVYWTMGALLIGTAVWLTARISDNFAASLTTIIVASISLFVMAEIMHALAVARAQAQEVLNRQHRESRYLSELGMALLNAEHTDTVFEQLGAFLAEFGKDMIIIITETTPDRRQLVTRQVLGIEPRLLAKVERHIGFKIIGRAAPIMKTWRKQFLHPTLQRLPGGLSEFTASEISERVAKATGRVLGIHEVYTIGITGHGQLWGSVNLLTRRANLQVPDYLIETAVYHCSSTLSRIAAIRNLSASEQKYRLLFENLSAGFALHEIIRDEAGEPTAFVLLEANSALETLFQVPKGSLIGRSSHETVPPTEQGWLAAFTQVARTGNATQFEIFSPTMQHWFQATAYTPEPERLAVILHDITAQKRAQEALQQSEERYRTLYDQSADGIYLHALDGTILDVNQMACVQVGYSREELLQMSVRELLPAETPWEDITRQWQEWSVGDRLTIEGTHQRKDSTVFPVEISTGIFVFGGENQVLSIVRDITARKQTEAARAEYREQLEALVRIRTAEHQAQYAQLDAILRSAGDAILMTDAKQQIRYVNPSFSALTGHPSEDLLGRHLEALDRLLDITPRLSSLLPGPSETNPWRSEIRIQRRDGRVYDAALTIAPIFDDAGQTTGLVFTHHDISQSKDLDRARNQFIANVSHQFRTPLTALKTHLHLLQNTHPAEHQQRHLQAMTSSLNWLTQLVQDTLELSTLDSGKGAETWGPVSLPDIISGVLEGRHNQAVAAGVTMEAIPFTHLPPVQGDARRLAQAVHELVENAIAFTPAGGQVTVGLRTVEIEEDPWIAISVRDSGPGIPSEEIPQLFERFFRGRVSEAGHTAGAGLGLSIAKKIIEAHGGRITVDSADGRGSTFTLWLRPDTREAPPPTQE